MLNRSSVFSSALLTVGLMLLSSCQSTPPQIPTPRERISLDDIPSLSNEQIMSLSEGQLEALDAEALQRVEAFSEKARLQATFRWPSFSDALFVATGVNHNDYLRDYYNKTVGPDWSDDGCTKLPPSGFDSNACRHHDFGYGNLPKYRSGRNESVRRAVDDRFFSNLNLRCRERYRKWYQAVQRANCHVRAVAMYAAVREFGDDYYYEVSVQFDQ
jgi:Prokaryotic phospholipase A2